MYGKMARKYDAFPALFTPLMIIAQTHAQASSSHRDNFQSGLPAIVKGELKRSYT